MPVRPHERVLEDLLGRTVIAGQPVGRPVDERAIAIEEGLERVEIVRLDQTDELRV
jgi:hypothetical protein